MNVLREKFSHANDGPSAVTISTLGGYTQRWQRHWSPSFANPWIGIGVNNLPWITEEDINRPRTNHDGSTTQYTRVDGTYGVVRYYREN